MKTTYDVAFRPHTYAELREMSREHMEAINRHEQELLNRRVASLTIWIAIMTGVYTLATLLMLLIMGRPS